MKNSKQSSIGFEKRKQERYGEIHTEVFELLKSRKKALQDVVEQELDEYLDSLPCDNQLDKFCFALSDEVYWLSERYLKRRYDQSIAVKHFGYFIYALKKRKILNGLSIMDCDVLEIRFRSFYYKIKKSQSFCESLGKYLRFMKEEYEHYFYDDSVIPVKDGDTLFLFQKPEDFYRKWLNSCRSKVLLALEKNNINNPFLNKIIENAGCDVEDKSMLLDGPVCYSLLNALKLSHFPFKVREKELDYQNLYFPFKHFIVSFKASYKKLLDCFPMEYSLDKFNDLTHLSQISSLFVLDGKRYNDEKEHFKSSGRFWADYKDFVAVFAHSHTDNKSFHPEITPFFKIGDVIFCPTILLTQFDFVYGFIQIYNMNVIKQGEQLEVSKKVEEALHDSLQSNAWETIVPPVNTGGDADLILRDQYNVLLMQLKKQNFSTDAKRRMDNQIQLDEHAAVQLNKYEKSHLEIATDHQSVKKWIVSSFDNCGNSFDGCRKVSFLDLLYWFPSKKFKNLSQFIEDVEEDKPIREIIEKIKEKKSDFITEELGNALPIIAPTIYLRQINGKEKGNDFMRMNELMLKFENASTTERQLLFEELRTFEKPHPDSFVLKHYLGICCLINGDCSKSED